VPVAQLRWIEFPSADGAAGSVARVRNRAAWPEDVFREARVHQLIGALEQQTRLARVLVTVADPLAHEAGSAGQPLLMVGSYVELRIAARPIENVIRMNRDFLRQNDTVWVNEDGVLRIRRVDVVFGDDRFVYVGAGLKQTDLVVTTNLSSVFEGAALRLEGATE